MHSSVLSAALSTLVLSLSIIALSYAYVVQTQHIAVYHDELWNYPAAVALMRGESWLAHQEFSFFGYPVPLVSGPYQGALKSWFLAPILGSCGTSPFVLRGVNCVLGFAYLLSLFWALKGIVYRPLALSVFALPIVDPNFLFFVPTDTGPFLLQIIFMSLAIGAFNRAYLYKDGSFLLLATAMASLTLADKLTSLPFVLVFFPLVAVWLWPYRGQLLTLPRLCLLFLVSLLPLLPHSLYFFQHGFHDLFMMTTVDAGSIPPFSLRLQNIISGFFEYFFEGSALIHSFLAPPSVPTVRSGLAMLGAILLLCCPLLFAVVRAQMAGRTQARESWKCLLFSPCLFVGTLLAMPLFPGLFRPWHFFVLHPAFILSTVSLLAFVMEALNVKFQRWFLVLASGILAFLLVQSSLVSSRFFSLAQEQQGVNLTSLALYDLADVLQSQGTKKIVCLSYSLCNPLYVLSGGQLQIVDASWGDFSNDNTENFEQWLQQPDTVLIYRHAVRTPGMQESYHEWLNRGSSWLHKQKELSDRLTMLTLKDRRGTEFGMAALKTP